MRHICLLQANGATPLFAASSNGHVKAVRALIDAGASVSQASVSVQMVEWGPTVGCVECAIVVQFVDVDVNHVMSDVTVAIVGV